MILANQNIITGQDASSPLLLATFTPTISGEYFANVNLSLLAGTGVYRFITTRQIGGVGAIYQSATAAVGVSAGITTLTISTIPTPLLAGDVLKIYVQGLAGDTAIDGVTEIFRSDTLTNSDEYDGYPLDELVRLVAAALLGKLSGGGTGFLNFRDLQDTKNRIVSKIDLATGDRLEQTLDGT